ncbi:MAG TPA: YkvA family protein [Anaerolineales bacterium]|nr:YkvA family protein [Anaerolineales bacterium]
MTERKNSKLVPAQGGLTRDFVNRLKLIFRLMGDSRVSPLVKLIPVGALAYLISPIDLIMGIPGVAALDDAAILWFGSNLFVELCPPEVVQEHMQALGSNLDNTTDDIVDVDATDINDNR